MLEEIHLYQQEGFVLAEVLSESPNWILVKSYNDLGDNDSYQFILKSSVRKRLSETPYLNYFHYLIEKQSSSINFSIPFPKADLQLFLSACQGKVLTIFLIDDTDGKTGKLNKEQTGFSLTEFDYNCFKFTDTYDLTPSTIERVVLDRRDFLLLEYLSQM